MDPANSSPIASLLAACIADPERPRFTFLHEDDRVETLCGGELITRVDSLARGIETLGKQGDRILLPYPAGLDFLVGFLACIAANRIPVPANYPKPHRPLSRYKLVSDNCQAAAVLTTAAVLRTLGESEATRMHWCAAEDLQQSPRSLKDAWGQIVSTSNTQRVLFLQYTSGSTSHPKGVTITPANLLANLRTINHGFGIELMPREQRVVCSWLPAYHDMGLVGVLLSTLVHDGHAILMSPSRFLRRPISWLNAIEEYSAAVTVAPCFGYQWATAKVSTADAAHLDLSSVKLAACGAEPISAAVLDQFARHFSASGFDPAAFYPCYGLAEATLMVSGEHRGETTAKLSAKPAVDTHADVESRLVQHFRRGALQSHRAEVTNENTDSVALVSCGRAGLDTEIVIADPKSGQPLPEDSIGEILVRGPSVAAGYWDDEERTSDRFGFDLDGSGGRYLRTGDLGFLHSGSLFVTGRLKELIIVAGQNFYPHDLESTAAASHPAVAGCQSAAFSVPGESTERLVLVQEIARGAEKAACQQAIRQIRLAIAATHELNPHAVLLVRTAAIPRTSSGKIQRSQARQYYIDGRFEPLSQWQLPAVSDPTLFPDLLPLIQQRQWPRVQSRIVSSLLRWVATNTDEAAEFIRADQSFAEMGVDSLLSVQMSLELEQWLKIRLSPVAAWTYPTPAKLAEHLVELVSGGELSEAGASRAAGTAEPQTGPASSAALAEMLDEIESMDEAQVEALLSRIGNGQS